MKKGGKKKSPLMAKKLPWERPAGGLWGRAPQKRELPGCESRQPLLRSLPQQGCTVRVVQLAAFLEG